MNDIQLKGKVRQLTERNRTDHDISSLNTAVQK